MMLSLSVNGPLQSLSERVPHKPCAQWYQNFESGYRSKCCTCCLHVTFGSNFPCRKVPANNYNKEVHDE